MTASNYLSIIAIGLIVIGTETRVFSEGDVTIDTPPSAVATTSTDDTTPDGTPVIHKSFHKKKVPDSETAPVSTEANPTPSFSSFTSSPKPVPASSPAPATTALPQAPVPAAPSPKSQPPASIGPTVETGLPVARHTHGDTTTSPVPAGTGNAAGTVLHLPPGTGITPARQLAMASIPSLATISRQGSAPTSYTPSLKSTNSSDNFTFLTTTHKGPKNIYPWKRNIVTTKFFIGEGSTPVSSTTNVASAWDEDWRRTNGGSDNPDDHVGYVNASHANRVNSFYVALPFNDLAFPDLANRWLPPGWHRPPKDGKQVSACKDRWVEIKNQEGKSCFAQWEDVGPYRYDHPEYVFGSDRPDTRAGLDVSPAVFDYLNLNDKNQMTSWRFVDDEDVPPGYWLKYEEQAVFFRVFHEPTSHALPMQAVNEPVDDSSDVEASKKKVGAAKG